MALPTHALYDKHLPDWTFHRLLYEAGDQFIEDYLERHPVELAADHTRRKARAIIPNHLRAIIDTYSSHLLSRPVVRSAADFADGRFFNNVDMMGTDADGFAERCSQLAQREGRVAVIVDRWEPDIERKSRADDDASGVRPYWSVITAENLINWKVSRDGEVEWVTIREDFADSDARTWIEEDEEEYKSFRVWTADEWILFRQTGEDEPQEVERGNHPVGRVPIEFLFYGIRETADPLGRATITDIAPMNRRLVNLYSLIDEQIQQQVFAMLVVDSPTLAALQGSSWSVAGAIGVPLDSTLEPYYLEPSTNSITAIADQIRETESAIRFLSGLGRQNDASAQASSGKALSYMTMDKVARLKKYAQKHEEFEARLMALNSAWMETTPDDEWTASYTREFKQDDIKNALESAVILESLDIKGTAAIENKIAATKSLLGDRVSAKTMSRIDGELRGLIDPATGNEITTENPLSLGARGQEAAATFNGAQIKSLVEILESAGAQTITRESAQAAIALAFGITDQDAADLLGSTGQGSPIVLDPAKPAAFTPG